MGMYDTVLFKNKKGEEAEIQFKNGECLCDYYEIGNELDLLDGIYYAPEGAFVVFNKKVVAAFEEKEPFMFDKWGGGLNFPQLPEYFQVPKGASDEEKVEIKCIEYSPTQADIKRYPHYQSELIKCWKTSCGTYEIILKNLAKHVHLKVHRLDDKPIHNFMDMLKIKNAILGEYIIAIEIYPKQSDFKDGSHTYHLWTWEGIEVPNLADIPKYH